MRRRATRGADIAPDSFRYYGINAEKCIAYLRGIGAEIDDATADSWLDAQAAHRFLDKMKRPVHEFRLVTCACGELEGYMYYRRGRAVVPRQPVEPAAVTCATCNTMPGNTSRLVYLVAEDGSEEDCRPHDERWQPFDWREIAGRFA